MLDSSYDRRLRRTMELTAGPSTTSTTSALTSVILIPHNIVTIDSNDQNMLADQEPT